MIGKIFITRSGYDPQLGKHVKDPYLGTIPTLGACRPDIRKQLKLGDHIFVISGKMSNVNQFVMIGFQIERKMDARKAYNLFPEHRLRKREDGQLTGNIIVNDDGKQHALDNHPSFDRRIENYVVGANAILPSTSDEIDQSRAQTLNVLRDIFQKKEDSVVAVVGRWGAELNEKQVLQLREWLESLKRASNSVTVMDEMSPHRMSAS